MTTEKSEDLAALHYAIIQINCIVRSKDPLMIRRSLLKDFLRKWLSTLNVNKKKSFFHLFPTSLPTHINCLSRNNEKERKDYVHLYLAFNCSKTYIHYLHADPMMKPYAAINTSLKLDNNSSINQIEAELITKITNTANSVQTSITTLSNITNLDSTKKTLFENLMKIMTNPTNWPTEKNPKHDVVSSIDLLHLISTNISVVNILLARDASHSDPPSNSAISTMVKQFTLSFSDEGKILSS